LILGDFVPFSCYTCYYKANG
jgi:hypothetical protein